MVAKQNKAFKKIKKLLTRIDIHDIINELSLLREKSNNTSFRKEMIRKIKKLLTSSSECDIVNKLSLRTTATTKRTLITEQ